VADARQHLETARAIFRRHPMLWTSAAILVLLALTGLVLLIPLSVRVEALRARHATGPSWSFPSRLYTAGVPFVEGRTLPFTYLRRQLALRGYRQVGNEPREPGTWAMGSRGIAIFLRGFREVPDPAGHGGPERVLLEIANGTLMRVHRQAARAEDPSPDRASAPRLEPVVASLVMDDHRIRRTWVPLSRVPKVVRDAVIAGEDRRFYKHRGLDLRSNLRALMVNLKAGGVRQGGSTITQQLARGLFLGPQRTWDRKVREIFLAVGLEILLSKDQILEMYLNMVYWGRAEGGGIGGIAEAARWYFDEPVDSLRLSEAALLAGIIPAPNSSSPFRDPQRAKVRRNAVLSDMVAAGVLNARIAERAKRLPLGVRRGPPPPEHFPSVASYVREWLVHGADPPLPEGALEQRGLAILTTIDAVWQLDAERGLTEGINDQERWRGRTSQSLEGAFVAIDPSTGYVRAMVGGRHPGIGDFNRATQARRQPGSAIKPLVYASALERGPHSFTPASTLADLRREFDTPQGPWSPRNDDGRYHETVTIAKALAHSINVATANLVEAVGPPAVAREVGRLGVEGLKAVPSIGLGTTEVTLLQLTSAYACFPNGGWKRAPTPVRVVLDGRGKTVGIGSPRADRVLTRPTAALMTGLLEDVVIFGVAYPLRADYGFTRGVGGKTGTTNDYKDAWFIGFTPDVVAGVWVGYDTPQSLARPAAQIAIPVWAGIARRMLDGFPERDFDGNGLLEQAWIDPWTGGLARQDCLSPMRVPFIRGSVPRRMCERDHAADWAEYYTRQAIADSIAHADEQENSMDEYFAPPPPDEHPRE
jgi:1A family penicillin-binding protein